MKARHLAAALLAAAAAVLAWTPPERVDRRPDNYVVYCNDIAVGPDGTPHIVWSECPRETYFEMIKYSRRDHDTWTIPINISRDSGDLRTPTIVVDSTGVPLVVWTEESSQRVRYVRFLGDTWSIPKLCFPTGGITPRLTIDSRNRIHLLFENCGRPGVIWYSYYISEADSWAQPCTVAFAPFELGWSDLTVDRQDYLHAVWMSWTTLNIEYSFNDGTGWSEPVEVPNPAPGTQAAIPRVATDTFNQPHVVWDETRVYYSCKDGDTWTAARRLYEDWSGYPVICSDSLNQLHVVFVVGRNFPALWYIVKGESGWTQPEFLTDTAGLAELIVHDTLLHLAYRKDWFLYYTSRSVRAAVAEPAPETPARSLLTTCTIVGAELTIRYRLAEAAGVRLVIYDTAGRCIRSMDLGCRPPGTCTQKLRISELGPPGAYVVELEQGGYRQCRKVITVR